MVLKIWLDDIRTPPDNSWVWAKTVSEAKFFLKENNEEVCISFDHDLGENASSGYDLACYIEELAAQGQIFNIIEWTIHSANPVGAANIRKAMQSFDRFRVTNELRKYMIKENEGIKNV